MGYLPHGVGCGMPPDLPMSMGALTRPAASYMRPANHSAGYWDGFCQIGWTACPDARANRDYLYYAKQVAAPPSTWLRQNGAIDAQYCLNNGWLEPEIRNIVNNFTALQAKGEELCKTKYARFDWKNTMKVESILTGINNYLGYGQTDSGES